MQWNFLQEYPVLHGGGMEFTYGIATLPLHYHKALMAGNNEGS